MTKTSIIVNSIVKMKNFPKKDKKGSSQLYLFSKKCYNRDMGEINKHLIF